MGDITQQRTPNFLNVKDFSAVGDGLNDDTTPIMSAITACQNAGGGVVFFPAGTYKVSSPLSITASGVSLWGTGRLTSLLKSTAAFGTNNTSRGIVQFISGPTQFVGNEICDLGFDMSASNETNVNCMAAIYQVSVPLAHFAVRRVQFLNTQYADGLYCNGLGQGVGSYDIKVEDVYGHNGGFDVGLFANGAQTNALVHSIVVRDIHALIDGAVNDDRVIISSHNGGSGTSEMRDVVVERVFLRVVSGASGTINGVKLDGGSGGVLHRVKVQNVFMFSIAGITANSPVYMEQADTTTVIGDIEIDGVWGNTTGRLRCLYSPFNPPFAAPSFLIRNIHLEKCQDIIGIEVYDPYTPADDLVVIERCTIKFATSVSGSTPIGILLTGGASAQGAAGSITIRDVTILSASTGISNNLTETGSAQASTWSNLKIERVFMDTVSTRFNIASGTVYKISDCPGYNPQGYGVTQPSVPSSTTAQTNTTGVDCMVLVTGGTVSNSAIGGTNTGQTSGWFRVPANQTITLTYSVAPSWSWYGE